MKLFTIALICFGLRAQTTTVYGTRQMTDITVGNGISTGGITLKPGTCANMPALPASGLYAYTFAVDGTPTRCDSAGTPVAIGGSGSTAQSIVLPLAHRIIGVTTYNSPHVVMAAGASANTLDLGSGYYLPVMQFPNSSSQSITVRTVVPKWWSSGTVTLTLVGTQAYGAEATNKYNVQTGCIASGGTITPTYNTAQSATFAVTNAKQSYGTISSLTMTGCSGGLVMWIQITRDETVDGNLAAATYLSEVVIGY